MQLIWIKLLGGGLILLAGWLISQRLNRADARRLSQLDSLIALLRFIKVQIDCYCVPVNEILRRCEPSLLAGCGTLTPPHDFFALLDTITPPPDDAIMSVLRSFAGELGGSYRDEQLKSCDYHINRLNNLREPFYAEIQKRKKLNTTLCLSVAAGVVILFL